MDLIDLFGVALSNGEQCIAISDAFKEVACQMATALNEDICKTLVEDYDDYRFV